MTGPRIVAVNCGSTTLKFALFEAHNGEPNQLAAGEVRGIGGSAREVRAVLRWSQPTLDEKPLEAADHAEAALTAVESLAESGVAGSGFDAVVHRVVHGGEEFRAPVVLDAATIDRLEDAGRLAPLHNAPALAAARALLRRYQDKVQHFASFDTSFHRTMPPRAAEYALPRELAERHGLRRFGFHGLAHEWMALRAPQLLGREAAGLRLVTLQLGGGCSAAAIENGRSMDTSMGLTPLEGLMMATRSGDLDPALPGVLARLAGLDVHEVERILTEESGLLGVSGRSPDMRDLVAAATEGDGRAALAVEMFCYRVRKQIGAYMAALGGCDALVFGGGIGEHQPEVRRRICQGLEWAGVHLDERANAAATAGDAVIGAARGSVGVLVVHAEEELLMARDAALLLNAG